MLDYDLKLRFEGVEGLKALDMHSNIWLMCVKVTKNYLDI